ncbi:hypothetical protein GF351_03020 [Candidatus Woesearchaeota archaeon]|nr:hypothetical protein [Candidatus Woesearchaeota archaeon]
MRWAVFLLMAVLVASPAAAVPKIYVTISDFPGELGINDSADFRVTVDNIGDEKAFNIIGSFSYSPNYNISSYIFIDSLSPGDGLTETYTITPTHYAVSEGLQVTIEKYLDAENRRYNPTKENYWANRAIVEFIITDTTGSELKGSYDDPNWEKEFQPDIEDKEDNTYDTGAQGSDEQEDADDGGTQSPASMPFDDETALDNDTDGTAGEALEQEQPEDAADGQDAGTDGDRQPAEEPQEILQEPDIIKKPNITVGILILLGSVAFAGIVIFLFRRK